MSVNDYWAAKMEATAAGGEEPEAEPETTDEETEEEE